MNDVFAFIRSEKANFPVTWMCHKLGVARASFYRWLRPARLLIGSLANDDTSRPLDDVVREIRANIAANSTWRYSAFYSQRFGSSISTAKAAAFDVFTSGNLSVAPAVKYTLGGFEFPLGSTYGGTGIAPSAAELAALSDVWANLISGMAASGASVAPSP